MALTKITRTLLDTGVSDSSDATAITIDSSEKVGIGETTPLGKLHVKSADSGGSADSGADELVIEGSGDSGIQILSGTSDNSTILFGDSGDSAAGGLRYEQNNNALNFRTNGTWNRLYIDSSGNIGIGTASPTGAGRYLHFNSSSNVADFHITNSVTGTASTDGFILRVTDPANVEYVNRESTDQIFYQAGSEKLRILTGGGITFNGDTADANGLDDYERGTYTATITCASGSITLYSGYDLLAYTKIGRIVHVQGKLTVNTLSSPTGATTINLPFTINNLNDRAGFCTHMGLGYFNGSAISTGYHGIYMEGTEGTAYIRPYVLKPSSTAGNAPSTNNLGDDHMAQGSDIYVNFTFIAS
mgnify:CR=1 FL=1|tara:strand:- start:67 stop:1143 length:1077 start_codon:yes stop_codon:yes gene_type:complete